VEVHESSPFMDSSILNEDSFIHFHDSRHSINYYVKNDLKLKLVQFALRKTYQTVYLSWGKDQYRKWTREVTPQREPHWTSKIFTCYGLKEMNGR